MILGSYYLTMQVDGEKGEGMYFKDDEEALLAYQNLLIHFATIVPRFFLTTGKSISNFNKFASSLLSTNPTDCWYAWTYG